MLITKMTLGSLGELVAFDQRDVTYVTESVKSKCPCRNYSKVGRTIDIISGIYSGYLTRIPGFELSKTPDEQKSMVLMEAIRKICAEAPDYEDTEADRMWNNPPESCFENKDAGSPNEEDSKTSSSESKAEQFVTGSGKSSRVVTILSYLPVFAVGGALLTAIKNMRNKKSKKSIGRKPHKRRRK